MHNLFLNFQKHYFKTADGEKKSSGGNRWIVENREVYFDHRKYI